MKTNKWYVADFETTSYNYYIENGYTKVWLWAICNSDEEIEAYGETIESFMEWCEKHPKSIVYFHNLKFDGSFILNYLLNNDYEYKDKLLVKDNKGFSTLIGEEGQYYQIAVNFRSNCNIKFYDSLKIIPLKVKEISKAFGIKEEKEIIDYEKYEVNQKTLSYIFKDVLIVAKALKYFKATGLNKMTIGGNAYEEFRKELEYHDAIFPQLDEQFLIYWRKAYRGGRCQVNPLYAGKVLSNVRRFDLNSMYPYIQAYCDLPYGEPIKITEVGQYKFELYNINIEFKLKKGHMPTLLKNGSMFINEDSYYTDSDGIINIQVSNIDFELMQKHYDIAYCELLDAYGFKTSNKIFRKFILKYYKKKSTTKGGERMVYKLILNNLYGKYGSKCKGKHKIPILDNEVLSYEMSEEHDMRKYYLPVAIAITSHAHALIDKWIEYCGDNFVYCDTDSIHTLCELPSEIVDNKELGKFKLEGIEIKSKYLRQKCYVYVENMIIDNKEERVYTITCAGMNDTLKEWLLDRYEDDIFDIFKLGLELNINTKGLGSENMKKRPMQVKGGVVLAPVPFTLKGVVA